MAKRARLELIYDRVENASVSNQKYKDQTNLNVNVNGNMTLNISFCDKIVASEKRLGFAKN